MLAILSKEHSGHRYVALVMMEGLKGTNIPTMLDVTLYGLIKYLKEGGDG